MKKFAIYTTILIAGIVMPQLNAEPCSNSDLHGSYSFVASGTFGGAPFVTAGQTIYNGDGTASGIITANSDGIVIGPAPWTATYSLSPMVGGGNSTTCVLTKTITVAGGLMVTFFGTAADNFKELRFIATTACQPDAKNPQVCDPVPVTISGTAKKQ